MVLIGQYIPSVADPMSGVVTMSAASKNWTRTALAMALAGLVALMSGGLLLAVGGTATAGPGSVPCVPSEAWTETVVVTPAVPGVPAVPATPGTPAVPAVTVDHPAVPAVAEVWANWSPNDTKGPQDYTPIWPTDVRGTWHVHDQIPGGHVGPDGVYNRSNENSGKSSWFYRQNGKDAIPAWTEVITPAVPAVPGTPEVPAVAEVPAVTQTVNHPAVVCETTTQPPTTETTTQPPTQVPEVEPTATPSPEGEETASPESESPESESPESESPEVLGVQESQPPKPQAQVPTAVDAGYAGEADADPWAAALVVGGLALLLASGAAVVQARKA